MVLCGLSGFAGSGKDTLASELIKQGYERVAFADKLKDALLALNPFVTVPIRMDEVKGFPLPKEEHFRVADVVRWHGWDWAKTYSPDIRGLLQRMGTEVGRTFFGDNIWVELALGDYATDIDKKIVVTDVRFPNEAEYIRNAGGYLFRIERPGVKPPNSHVSEFALAEYPFNAYLVNDGTPEDLSARFRVALTAVDKDRV